MILRWFLIDLRYVSSYFLSVSPAVAWLTVYRRLQVRIVFQLVGLAGNYRTILEIGGVFLKKLSFYTISIHFSDFSWIFIHIAEAHAQGFASLQPVARESSNGKLRPRGVKNMMIFWKFFKVLNSILNDSKMISGWSRDHLKYVFLYFLRLPGGDLIDGLPPAASTKYSLKETRDRRELTER